MVFYKIIFHLIAVYKKIFFKILYGRRVRFGKKSTFRKRFSLMIGKKGNVTIGEDCFFNNDCSISSLNEITIGNGTIIGEGVKIYDHNHIFNKKGLPISEQGYSIGKVYIGDNCWIGSNAVILKDAIINDNCVIGAGCVVKGNVEEGSVIKQTDNYIVEKIHRV